MFVALLSSTGGRGHPQAVPILTSALLHPSPLLRTTVLQALSATATPLSVADSDLVVGLLIAQHSEEEGSRKMAAK